MRCLPPQRWPAAILLSALLGGVIAAGSHLAKSGGRALINTSPEPFSNWTASFSEDTLTLAGLWLALKYPLVFLTLLTVFILFALWLLPKLWRGIKRVFAAIRKFPANP